MKPPIPIVVHLCDYIWLANDSVQLPIAPSDTALLAQYVVSPAFHTSFLPSDNDETGIHGPFLADRIKPSDFMPLEEPELEDYLASVQFSQTPEEDETQRARVLPDLRSPFQRGSRCFVLKVDERNEELFHDWGWVFTIFRELVFAASERDCLERFIIGCD